MASVQEVLQLVVHSCSMGDYQALQNLLFQHPDININMTTEGGATLLMHTIIGAGVCILHSSIRILSSSLYMHPCTIFTYVGTAINPGGHYVETCQLLVQYGIQLETADQTHGRTAAHWTVYYHVDDILTELIIAGN